MNAVEIEEAITLLAEQPFVALEFPYAFLEAFGNKETTIKRLRSGNTNKSDILGAVLQQNNIHIAVCEDGFVTETLTILKESPSSIKNKVKFILATDGKDFQAEDMNSGETVVCDYHDFHNFFGFFLPLAGISTVKQIRDNAFDIKATSRLNKLYIELLRHNPEWATSVRRHDMNHFLARLIFCFFAEDTDIFDGEALFTETVQRMSASDASDTHEVISEIFRTMDIKQKERSSRKTKIWANKFPYVNGELFSGSTETPNFTKIARSYLLHVGNLDWKKINPDIFGSMIQAVADEDERGALGMHYTSVPNILKVLNPLFLDDLWMQFNEAGDNSRKLLNLRKRISRIRVFDPACGSGNFLVIAYKQMRQIEFEVNKRRGETDRPSEIPLTNLRGIELRDFSAEIARLALIIAEYQCDIIYRGQKLALAEFLPLNAENWITCGNALRINWLSICPPKGNEVMHYREDLFSTPLNQGEVHFENDGGETYICANPPYQGSVNQTIEQKDDMARTFAPIFDKYKDLDYVAAFLFKAAQFNKITGASCAFVTTNSVTQGEQVALLWPLIFKENNKINFAHTSFPWSNLASNKAAVTCVILGLTTQKPTTCRLYTDNTMREVNCIGPYLVPGSENIIFKRNKPFHNLSKMDYGNKPTDGGNLILSGEERMNLLLDAPESKELIRQYIGSQEFIRGISRYCLWITDTQLAKALSISSINSRIERVKIVRQESKGQQANQNASNPHKFVFAPHTDDISIVIPQHFSQRREFVTVGLLNGKRQIIANSASAIYNANLVDFAVLSSKLHYVWMDTVAGRIKSDYRYSSTLVWNTFPLPMFTEKNRIDLSNCAKEIMSARERLFPTTIADLYDPEKMPVDLRQAHERNDEVLERIYIGRRFKNDTERLEKLFYMYTQLSMKKSI